MERMLTCHVMNRLDPCDLCILCICSLQLRFTGLKKNTLRHASLVAIIMRTRSTFIMSAQLDILPLLIPVMIDNWGVTDNWGVSWQVFFKISFTKAEGA